MTLKSQVRGYTTLCTGTANQETTEKPNQSIQDNEMKTVTITKQTVTLPRNTSRKNTYTIQQTEPRKMPSQRQQRQRKKQRLKPKE